VSAEMLVLGRLTMTGKSVVCLVQRPMERGAWMASGRGKFSPPDVLEIGATSLILYYVSELRYTMLKFLTTRKVWSLYHDQGRLCLSPN